MNYHFINFTLLQVNGLFEVEFYLDASFFPIETERVSDKEGGGAEDRDYERKRARRWSRTSESKKERGEDIDIQRDRESLKMS